MGGGRDAGRAKARGSLARIGGTTVVAAGTGAGTSREHEEQRAKPSTHGYSPWVQSAAVCPALPSRARSRNRDRTQRAERTARRVADVGGVPSVAGYTGRLIVLSTRPSANHSRKVT